MLSHYFNQRRLGTLNQDKGKERREKISKRRGKEDEIKRRAKEGEKRWRKRGFKWRDE